MGEGCSSEASKRTSQKGWKTRMYLPLALLMALAAAPNSAAPVRGQDVPSLVNRMQAFYEKTKDFTASFQQTYKHKAFKRTQESKGAVAFMKPGYMRWDYEKPAGKTFVLANERVYAMDPEAKTLTIAAMNSSQLSASVTFLWGKGRLAEEFKISKSSSNAPVAGGTVLELIPLQPDSRFQKIFLEVDPASAQVRRSTVVDPDGSENTIVFNELKPNLGLTREKFQIVEPPGTQRVDLTAEKK